MLLAEVAPVAPALPILGELLILVVCLGICYAIVYIAKAFFGLTGGVLGKLPVVGGWINSSLHAIEQKVVHIMGLAIVAVQGQVGTAWHQLARLIDWMGREIRAHSNMLYLLASLLLGQEWAVAIKHAIDAVRSNFDTLTRMVHGTVARIVAAEERLRHGIGADVLPRIRAGERAIDRVLGKDLAGIRARERALEHGAADTWKWIRTHPGSLASGAFVGAVAFALERLGGTWIRCTNWKRIGRGVCNTPGGDIEALLGLLAIGATVASFRELVKLGQEVEHGVAAVLQDIAKL